MKWQFVQEKIKKHGLAVFSAQEFRRALGVSPTSSKFLLLRYSQKGLLTQLKARRGLYSLSDSPPHPWLLANKLSSPSYISLETALAHYGIIPETVYAITSVTSRTTRTFTSMNLTFHFHKIKPEAFQGYIPFEIHGSVVFLAEPEKALADYLYFVHMKKKSWNDRLSLKHLKKSKLRHYLKLFNRKGLLQWARHVIS